MRRAALAVLVVMACALPARAVLFGQVFVHGKGFSGLADPSYAYDYWAAGSFFDQAKGCSNMPTTYTHVDGTRGLDAAFNVYDCGCDIPGHPNLHQYSYFGCESHFVPFANGYPGCYGTPQPVTFPLYQQGTTEQIYDFLQNSGVTDLTVVAHSMGGPLVRKMLSNTSFYDGCAFDYPGHPAYPQCQVLRQHQLAVNRAITTVMTIHSPQTGSEAADAAATLATGQWSWLTGWITDWLNPIDKSTKDLTLQRMAQQNAATLYGTSGRPWPIFTKQGEPLRVARWIALGSALTPGQNLEDNLHVEDYELSGCAQAVAFAGGWSDGLVSWASMNAVVTTPGQDNWRFKGQQDSAAVAAGGSQYVGNNHWHCKSGAGGRWRPLQWYQQAPAPPTCCGYPNCFSSYGCYGPSTSGWDGVPVPVCPDPICKRNQTRGYPLGGDEAFAISSYVQARVASVCGPQLNEIDVANGRQYPVVNGGAGGHWVGTQWVCYPGFLCQPPTVIGQTPMYDTYSPNSGLQICNAGC